MKCQRCGAELLDTDTFCVKCGQKVGEPARCPVCGEILREGTKFCHKCGAPVEEKAQPEDDEIPVTPQKTIDIPFDVIEKSIIMEAEQAVVKRDFSEAENARGDRTGGEEILPDRPEEAADTGNGERPSKVIRAVREGTIYEKPEREPENDRYEEDYEDTYGYEEDEYDDEEDENEKESGGFDLTKATMILGIVVLVVILIAGGVVLKKKLHFSLTGGGDTAAAEQTQPGEGSSSESGENAAGEVAGKLQIIKNVNMRNQPSTENSSVLGVAKTGEVYEYYELVGDSWYHIRLSDGSDAYVYKEYVEVLN